MEERESTLVGFNTSFNCFIDQVAVVAEAHLTHLEERLVAAFASHLSCRLLISLSHLWLVFSLTNSGGELMLLLRLLIITLSITILIIILFLVSGVHLRWSASIGRGRGGLLTVNLVN